VAKELPYLTNYKNVAELFQRIAAAKKPESFTTRYLADTLGLKSTSDRQLINLLKTLQFLDSAGRPTADYDQLKNHSKAAKAIGAAIRTAYEGLYAANEKAHELTATELKGLISQVAGSDSGVTSKILGTFSAVAKLADLSGSAPTDKPSVGATADKPDSTPVVDRSPRTSALRPEFHYNIQVHLPSNATEETYLSIFNALRKSFES